jgi:hypothetical protein
MIQAAAFTLFPVPPELDVAADDTADRDAADASSAS